jgi:transcriptional repressor NrdR
MDCPFCQSHDTKVTDSRFVPETNQIRRRRECNVCVERFTTYEIVELDMPWVIKRDGARASFDQQKLKAGLLRAVQKRPVSMDQIDVAISHILRQIRGLGEKEIESQKVGEFVMHELRELDDVAYVRFASVYHRFQDVDAFVHEVQGLLSTKNKPLVKK